MEFHDHLTLFHSVNVRSPSPKDSHPLILKTGKNIFSNLYYYVLEPEYTKL